MMLKNNWELFRIAKFSTEKRLPAVLARKEVDKLLRCVRPFNNYVYLVLVYKCESCGEIHASYRSCGNRYCPACQNHKTKQLTLKQLQKEISCNYFMITFTVPAEIRDFFLHNQKEAYSSFF